MSKLEGYLAEVETDIALTPSNVKDVQMKLPGIKHKWSARLIRCKIELNRLNSNRKELINTIARKLIEASPVNVSMLVARKKAEDHESLIDYDNEVQELLITIQFLEKTEKTLHSMSFDIKNLTEIMKLETL